MNRSKKQAGENCLCPYKNNDAGGKAASFRPVPVTQEPLFICILAKVSVNLRGRNIGVSQ